MSVLLSKTEISDAPIHEIVDAIRTSAPERWWHPGLSSDKACPASAEEAGSFGASRQRRDAIMRRFHEAVAGCVGEEPAMTALCCAIGVPQRTLNLCCREALGMSAKSYLMLRRMYSAEMALRSKHERGMTVTEIATRFGFWNLGRFSAQYRRLFGETPSQTLQESTGRRSAAACHDAPFSNKPTHMHGATPI